MKSSLDRRHEFKYRSVFDYHELYKHFIKPQILTITHVEKLVCLSALNYSVLSSTACEEPVQDRWHTAEAWEALIPNLPRKAYSLLESLQFRRCTLKLIELRTTDAGDTDKLLFELQDGNQIETCIMRYATNPLKGMTPELAAAVSANSPNGVAKGERATVCVSSQVGCKMGCSFCATGTLGLSANLTSGEILEQIIAANEMEKIHRKNNGTYEKIPDGKYVRNIVYMGMGEPLDNYDEVMRSIRVLTNSRMLGFTSSKVTLSTVGADPERIRRLIKDAPKISLALSLHAPTQALREAIVPTAKNIMIDDLLAACFAFVCNQRSISKTRAKIQRLCVEYCLLEEVNDTPEVAHELGRLLSPHTEYVMVNLIPYNPTDVSCSYRSPGYDRVQAFAEIVRTYGVKVFFRTEKGASIAGACGQLAASKKMSKTQLLRNDAKPDIEDYLANHQPQQHHATEVSLGKMSSSPDASLRPVIEPAPSPEIPPLRLNPTVRPTEKKPIHKEQIQHALSPSLYKGGREGKLDSDQSTTSTNSVPCSFFASNTYSDRSHRNVGQRVLNSMSVRQMFRWTSLSDISSNDHAHSTRRSPAALTSVGNSIRTWRDGIQNIGHITPLISCYITNIWNHIKQHHQAVNKPVDFRTNLAWYGGIVLGSVACGSLAFCGSAEYFATKKGVVSWKVRNHY